MLLCIFFFHFLIQRKCSRQSDKWLSYRRMTWGMSHGQRYGYKLSHDAMSRVLITWWRRQMETFSALLAICAWKSPVMVNSPHKGQWRGALMFSLILAWINGWVNNREAGDLRHHQAYYDVTVMNREIIPGGHSWNYWPVTLSSLSTDCNSPVSKFMKKGCCDTRDPFCLHGLILIPTGISNHMPRKVWNEMTYPLSNFNGWNVEVWEWISNFSAHLTM